ncbi:hypothetical protein D3C73_927570 [compost metagenome]
MLILNRQSPCPWLPFREGVLTPEYVQSHLRQRLLKKVYRLPVRAVPGEPGAEPVKLLLPEQNLFSGRNPLGIYGIVQIYHPLVWSNCIQYILHVEV